MSILVFFKKFAFRIIVLGLIAFLFWIPASVELQVDPTSIVNGELTVFRGRSKYYLELNGVALKCHEGFFGLSPNCPNSYLPVGGSRKCVAKFFQVRTKFGLEQNMLISMSCEKELNKNFSREGLYQYRKKSEEINSTIFLLIFICTFVVFFLKEIKGSKLWHKQV